MVLTPPFWFVECLDNQLFDALGGVGGETVTIHLSTSSVPFSPADLYPPGYPEPSNVSYHPQDASSAFWIQSTDSVGVTFSAFGFVFHFGNDSIAETMYQWWMQNDSQSITLAAGLIDPPYTPSLGGGTLRINDLVLTNGTCGPTVSNSFLDLTIDANGTALPLHIPDVGGPWSAQTGTYEIEANTIVPLSDADGDVALFPALCSDVFLTADCIPQWTSSVVWERPDLLFRWKDAANFWLIDVAADAGLLRLIRVTGGGFNLEGSHTIAAPSGATQNVGVRAIGQAIDVLWNGAVLISVASSFNQFEQFAGIRLGKSGASAKLAWTNFMASLAQ